MPDQDRRHVRGAATETRAAQLLERAGFRILERNFRCRLGELDLVASQGTLLVLVEVRLRTHAAFGGAAASITAAKRRRLQLAARYLLMRRPQLARLNLRFDAILASAEDGPLEWLRNVM